ncbi:MAG TPA: alginate export family protein, partial [Verrucomicrobiae bacterium]|nr:alginate export family protein [Verrucomicrobiae bacterium]
FDPVKYIQLNEQGDAYLTLGGQLRDRYEYFKNDLFGSGPQDKDGYNLFRAMLNADLHLGPNVRVFVQGISATEQDRTGGPRPSDVDEADLYQAFVDITIPFGADTSLTLRGGRQVIVFGAQRLIGVSDWTNVRRTLDGVRGTLATAGNTLDLFYAHPVRVLPYSFDDDIPDTSITGIYDTWEVPGVLARAKTKLEMYAFHVTRQGITFNQTSAGESRYTLGTRLTANPKPFDFDLESDYQFGRFNYQETHAFSIAAMGGYTLEAVTFAPRMFLGFDIASGGSSNSPGNTFDQLFPSGHDQFGIIDAIGRQNIIDVHPGLTLKLLENKPAVQQLTLLTEYRQFWRENNQDAVYTSSGSILRTSGGSNAGAIGGEIDLQVNWQINRYLNTYAGYSHFFHGPFITATGPHNDIDFAYSALTFTF